MRRTVLFAAAVLALTLAVPASAGVRWHATPAAVQAAPPPDGPRTDNQGTVIYNHFGNPNAGQAMIQTAIFNPLSDLALPISAQGRCRAVRVHRVTRIALRCVIHTRNGTDDDDATGPTANNGNQAANPRIFLALTPTIATGGTVPNPQFCDAWTEAFYAIRWDDGTLTSGKVLMPPSQWRNANCDIVFASGAP